MKIANRFLEIELTDNILKITKLDSGAKTLLDWPACALSVNKQIIVFTPSYESANTDGQNISQKFCGADMDFVLKRLQKRTLCMLMTLCNGLKVVHDCR